MRIGRTGAALVMATVATAAMVAATVVPANAAPKASVPAPPGGGLVGLATGARAAAVDAPICYFGACYDYVAARQTVAAAGASVLTLQAKPELDPADTDGHSLQELAVQSADGQQIVEVGWTVDRGLNGDAVPHLFTFYWVDGQPTCYNTGCGFVPTSRVFRPGMRLVPGLPALLQIRFHDKGWWISYDGVPIGYYPADLWQGRYTRGGLFQIFGEVASVEGGSCTDMGDGAPGASPVSSWFAGLRYDDGAAPVALSTLETSPSRYSIGRVRTTSYHLGGPGTGRCQSPTG